MSTEKTAERYTPGTGRRKRAVARVFLTAGKGRVTINDKNIETPNEEMIQPLTLVGMSDKFDISVKVQGGGQNGQIGAVRHGVARAIAKLNPELRKALRDAGMLTRDPREKERKKPGLKRARRAPQWQKR